MNSPMNPSPNTSSTISIAPRPRSLFVLSDRILFATSREWVLYLVASAIITFLAYPWYKDASLWIAPGVMLVSITVFHISAASKYIVPFPHVAILISSLQLIIAAWWEYYYPLRAGVGVGDRIAAYLSYAVPVVSAFAFGWALALFHLSASRVDILSLSRLSISLRLLKDLDLLVFGGLACALFRMIVYIGTLDFALLLSSELRFVGALGWMILRARGWKWRVALVYLVHAVFAARSGMFHSLILWGASLFVVWLYCFRPRLRTVLALTLFGILMVPTVEYTKLRVRGSLWRGESLPDTMLLPNMPLTPINKPLILGIHFVEGLIHVVTWDLEDEFLSHISARFNQGWVVNMVLQHVPENEPYAKGETIIRAIVSAVVPRVLAPDKYRAGGREYMERFAGYSPLRGTSINLGYSGEFYANFGHHGGILATGIYALLLGLLFRVAFHLSKHNPLWWAFVPFMANWAFKAEEGVGEIINWLVKGLIVTIIIVHILPGLRSTLLRTRTKPKDLIVP